MITAVRRSLFSHHKLYIYVRPSDSAQTGDITLRVWSFMAHHTWEILVESLVLSAGNAIWMNTESCQSWSQTYFSIIWTDFYGFYISLPTHKPVIIWRMRSQFTKIPILAIKNHKSLLIQYKWWRLYFQLSRACRKNSVYRYSAQFLSFRL